MPIDESSVVAKTATIVDDSVHVEQSRIAEHAFIYERAEIIDSDIGVSTSIDPDSEVVSSVIDYNVEIGAGTKIHNCTIDDGVRIGDNVSLEDSHIRRGSVIDDHTHVSESEIRGSIGKNCNVVESIVDGGSCIESECELLDCNIGYVEPSHWRLIEKQGFVQSRAVSDPYCRVAKHCNLASVRALESTFRENTVAVAGTAALSVVLSHVGESCKLNGGAIIVNSELGERCSVGERSVLEYAILQDDTTVGEYVVMEGRYGITIEIESGVKIGDSVSIHPGVSIGSDTSIGDNAKILQHASVAGDVTVGADAEIREGAVVYNGVEIGAEAGVGMHAEVGAGAHLGARSWVEEATQVPYNYVLQPDETYGGQEGDVVATLIPITATSEVWLYERLAEIADGKLTKEAIKATRPELLNHPLTQELLRMRPRPNRQALMQMARDANRDVKYMVEVVEDGWDGLQRIGSRVNDVMRFNYADELIESVTASVAQVFRQNAIEYLESAIKRDNTHETATQRTLGWIRYFQEDDAIVIEELQTDVRMLRDVMGGSGEEIPRVAMQHAPWFRRHERIVEREVGSDDWEQYKEAMEEAVSNFLVMTYDLYETMLATMLDFAAGRLRDIEGAKVGPRPPVEKVYLLTHETKSNVHMSGRVPVYPYKRLPSRFQSARKVPLPSDVPTENFQGAGLPKARLLRPNE